jgi:DNA-binding NtrC family response regulator
MKPLHVLVLNRSPQRLDALIALLRSADHRVDATTDESSALESFGSTGADVLLLDLGMPGLDLPALRRAIFSTDTGEPESLDSAERRHLALVLRHTGGNKRKAAHLLGISRSTLLNKVRKYGLEER